MDRYNGTDKKILSTKMMNTFALQKKIISALLQTVSSNQSPASAIPKKIIAMTLQHLAPWCSTQLSMKFKLLINSKIAKAS